MIGRADEVVVHRHRFAVDRDRIERRVGATVQRDPPEHLACRSVAMQVVVRVHADPVRGRHRAERRPPLHERAGDATVTAGAEPECRERRLPDRAEAQHVAAQTTRHREHRRDDRAARSGKVAAAVDPRRPESQRFFDRGDTALAHAHPRHAGIGRQPVDVVEGEPGIGDRREARVDGQRERIDHEPPADRRTADARQHRPMLEAIVGDGRSRGRALRFGHQFRRVGGTGRFEQRKPHVFAGFEADDHLLADANVVRVAADDVGGEVHRRVLGEGDDRDRVRRLEVGQPLVAIDRVRDDGRRDRRRPWATTRGCGTPGTPGRADGRTSGSRRTVARAAGRRRPTSRTTRSSA